MRFLYKGIASINWMCKGGRWFQNDLPTEYIKGIGFLYAKISQT